MPTRPHIYDTSTLPGGPLQPGPVLLQHDEASLYWVTTRQQQHVLVTFAERTATHHVELLRYCSVAEKHALENGALSLRDIYAQAPMGSLYVIHHGLHEHFDTLMQTMPGSRLPEAWLAAPGAYI